VNATPSPGCSPVMEQEAESARAPEEGARAATGRLVDASLEVLAALRALADVTEDIVRERRDSLLGEEGSERTPFEQSDPADARHTEPPTARTREQIPLTY
jgi:hypothetical protein